MSLGLYFIKKYLFESAYSLPSWVFFFFFFLHLCCFLLTTYFYFYLDTSVNSTSKVSTICEHWCLFSIHIINEGAK